MKKIILFTWLLTTGINLVQAQYFQGLYGSGRNDQLTDAHKTSLSATRGHFLTAPGASAPAVFTATRTNAAGGSISGGFFNNEYRLRDAPGGSPSLRVQEVKSVEVPGTGYALAGSYINGSSSPGMGVFFQQIDDKGMLLGAPVGYFINGGSFSNIRVKKIIVSTVNRGDFYILGYLTDRVSKVNRIFVLHINSAGALVWSNKYQLNFSTSTNDIPYDIIESPVRNPSSNSNEIIVVGEQRSTAANTSDAFLLRIDEGSGNIINPIQYYGLATTNDVFTCIKPASNGLIDNNSAGYVIGGYTKDNTPGTVAKNDFWFVAVNQTGTVAWSNRFDYTNAGTINNDDYCNDIIEHLDSSGAYEYFLAGYTDQGYFLDEDMVVIKADQNGNAVANGQFTYGTCGHQRCIRIDQEDLSSPGLSLYGTSAPNCPGAAQIGGVDQYVVKAKFNGFSCAYDAQTPTQNIAPGFLTDANSDNTDDFYTYTIYSDNMLTLDEELVCSDCAKPRPPLVAHWNFTNGSLVDDVNGLTGIINGGVTTTSGQAGTANTAYLFDGTSGYIQVPSSTVMDLTSWTLTALVRPDGFYSGTCQGNAIIWRGGEFTPRHYNMHFFDNAWDLNCNAYTPDHEVFVGGAAGVAAGVPADWLGAVPCTTNPCIATGDWYCIWVSYSAPDERLDVYVNGTYRVSMPWTNQYGGTPGIDDLFIGSSDAPGSSFPYFFKGAIDDIAIYGGAIDMECQLNCENPVNGSAKHGPTNIENIIMMTEDISIIPNPTSDIVEIVTPIRWINVKLTVFNAVGQMVISKDLSASRTTIDLSAFPAGVYNIKVTNGNKSIVRKMVKQ